MRFINSGGLGARVAVLAALASGSLWAFAAPAAQPGEAAAEGVWTAKDMRFEYQGFMSKYSCDGLRDKMRKVLLDLGARPDLQLSTSGCSSPSGPDPFPGVRIKMNVLQPAPDSASGAKDATVAAHWQTIDVTLERDPVAAAGDCELVEQIHQKILPLFSTRNVEYSSACVPHQLSIGGTRLRADVLVADAKAPVAAAAH
jgi:hypothetical protein